MIYQITGKDKNKKIKLDQDQIAECIADYYRSWNIQLDSENYVWDGMYLTLKVKEWNTLKVKE